MDLNLARSIHLVEFEYGVFIDEYYDWFKFQSQLRYIQYRNILLKQEQARANRKK